MFKNTASTFLVFAFDTTTNAAKTGDAANITAYVAIDGGAVTVLGDTSATELDSTNAKGYYVFTAAQAETNGDRLLITAKSSTANIAVIGAPPVIFTRPATGWLAPATAGRTLVVDAAGLADANMVKMGPTGSGTAQTARDIGASVLLSSGTGAGQISLSSGQVIIQSGTGTGQLSFTSGILAVNVTQFGGNAATTSGGRPEVNTSHIAGSAVSTSSAQIGVNVVNAGGTAWASGSLTAAVFASDAITAAKVASDVGTEIGTAVWATAARTLTANTNLNDLSAAGVRSAVGLASANLDTQLSTIDTVVDAILVDTGTTLDGKIDTIDGIVDAILVDTGTTLDGKLDTIDTNVDSILADTGTDGVVVAAASKTGYRLSSAGVDDIHDEVVDGTLTARQSMRVSNAALGGKLSGAGSGTETIRDPADAKNRIQSTVDDDGNRTAVTLDVT